MHIGRQEHVHALALTYIRCAIRRMLDHPALIQLERRLVDRFLVFGQEVQMLDAALVQGDRRPDVLVILAISRQQRLQRPVAHREAARERFLQEHIGRYRLDPRAGIAGDDGNGGRRCDRHLVGKPLHDAVIGGIRAGPALLGQQPRRSIGLGADLLEHPLVPNLGDHAFERHVLRLQEGMKAHHAQPYRALAHRGIFSLLHAFGRTVDEVLQHIVEEPHRVFHEERVVLPLHPGFQVQAAQAAHCGALLAILVHACRQRDFAAQIAGLHFQPGQLLVLRAGIIHVVGEDQVRLAGFHARGQDADPQRPRRNAAYDRVILRAAQRPGQILFHGAHEIIADQDAVMQVRCLAIRVAAGRPAQFHELFDFRVRHRQIHRRRAAPQRALADGQGQAVHHPDERNDAAGLAVHADFFADGAQIAPVAADAAAFAGQPHILVPKPHDAVQAVIGFVQKAADRQAARGAPIGEHRRRRHHPHAADIVI